MKTKKVTKLGTVLEADTINGVREISSLDDANEEGKYYEDNDFLDSLKDLGESEIIATVIKSEEIYDKIESEYGIN